MKDTLTPKAIVAALDAHIIGQKDAKRAVAVALRNRWRRQKLSPDLRDEVTPKNILMIGPTGCGKTEISRRLAKLADAPFVKVEATKFTEVGYVGRDVEQIARDLVEEAVRLEKERRRNAVKDKAEEAAMDRLLDALVGKDSSQATRESFRQRFRDGHLDQTEIELELQVAPQMPFEMPGGGQMGMINLGEMFGKLGGGQTKRRKLLVPAAWEKLVEEEADKRLDQDEVSRVALADAEANGIVFLDEIDKIAVSDVRGGSVSREGVQRDLLPLIEGTTVSTKYGPMKTDHILFIASGAFHVAKPSDLLPELQGRLPIRVELKGLTEDDFVAILSDTKASLPAQYKALIGTEGVTVEFTEDGIRAVARIAAEVNGEIENIGARRLQTVMEKLLEEVSFDAEDRAGSSVTVDAAYVEQHLAGVARHTDLSRFVRLSTGGRPAAWPPARRSELQFLPHQRGIAFRMMVSRAELLFDRGGAAEIMAHRQLVGHPHAAMKLNRILADEADRVRHGRLGRRDRAGALLGRSLDMQRGEIRRGGRLFDGNEHVDHAMLQRLEAGERLAELPAFLGVSDGIRQQLSRQPGGLGA